MDARSASANRSAVGHGRRGSAVCARQAAAAEPRPATSDGAPCATRQSRRSKRGRDGGVPGSEENPALQPALAGGDEKPTFQPALPGGEEKPTLQPALPGRPEKAGLASAGEEAVPLTAVAPNGGSALCAPASPPVGIFDGRHGRSRGHAAAAHAGGPGRGALQAQASGL